jgi:hypothetical protein
VWNTEYLKKGEVAHRFRNPEAIRQDLEREAETMTAPSENLRHHLATQIFATIDRWPQLISI